MDVASRPVLASSLRDIGTSRPTLLGSKYTTLPGMGVMITPSILLTSHRPVC